MVNLCKINKVVSLQELPILKRFPMKFSTLSFSYVNPFLLGNVLGGDILNYLENVIHFAHIDGADLPTRTMEYSPGMDVPHHPRNGQLLNISLLPLETRTGPFFILHKLTEEESENTAIATLSIFLSTQYKEVFLYEPVITQDVDICKFA